MIIIIIIILFLFFNFGFERGGEGTKDTVHRE